MKIVVINNQTAFVRHWLRWFRVKRAGEDWRELEIGKRYVKPKTIEDIAKGLDRATKKEQKG